MLLIGSENREEIEDAIISCILQKNELINELYVDETVFIKEENFKMVQFFKKVYKQYKSLDITLMCGIFNTDDKKNKMFEYWNQHYNILPNISCYYLYQEQLIEIYKETEMKKEISRYTFGSIQIEELIDSLNEIQNKSLMATNNVKKVSPDEMLSKIRNVEKTIDFNRLYLLNNKLKVKKRTINIIAARPSEGKSALGINLFCDLAKTYKCLYFNMEMTEEEVYERMLGIETGIPIAEIIKPINDVQDKKITEAANKIYNMNYQVINGSMNIKALKNKIIKEQRDEHLIVFIDYVGYITTKAGQSDKDRIGEVTRELNNLTKDYNCTIFLIAQINRNGSDVPTMQDLKDSGELEQSADTILLIHDENKEDTSDVKEIKFLIPKCRGSKRNVGVRVKYYKISQRMEILE